MANDFRHYLPLLGIAIGLFATTNLDDLLVLLGFYADPAFGVRPIVIGQYIGIGTLFCASAMAAALALMVLPTHVGFLGVLPLGIGLVKLWRLAFPAISGAAESHVATRAPTRKDSRIHASKIFTIAAITIANGADNIVVYTPWFSTHSRADVTAVGMVFAAMTAVWLAAARWLTAHRLIGVPIRRYGQWLLPFVLIGLGTILVAEAWKQSSFMR